MRAIACMFVLLLLTACGGGENSADAVTKEDAFIPDYSTAEGVRDAFIRAIQVGDTGLMSLTLLHEERDEVLPVYELRFAQSKKEGVQWRLEEVENGMVPGKEARSLFKYVELKDGKETGGFQHAWAVFLKTPDGSWKYSNVASKAVNVAWMARLKPPTNEPATNSPGD